MPAQEPDAPAMTRIDRVPPYSDEAERGVLGSILLASDKVLDLCSVHRLSPESFHVPAHQILYETMQSMASQGRPVDSLTLTERLNQTDQLSKIGGAMFLDQLVDSTPTSAHAEYYIDIVRQKFLLRAIIEAARLAETQCYDPDLNAHELLGQVEQQFLDISEDRGTGTASWTDLVNETIGQIENILTSGKGLRGISTGYTALDKTLMGMQPGNMIVLAARPSMGKTSLVMNIVENVALGVRDPNNTCRGVGIFSLEMSAQELVMRMICSRARVSGFKIAGGYISQTNHGSLVQAADKLLNSPIYLDDTPALDIMEVRARGRRMKKMYDIQLIVVDYLQLLKSDKCARLGREREIADVSGQLKAMAKELGVPVIVLSQLSRAPEIRDKTGRPKLSDLRDSGSIEQDADVVMLLRRPARYPEDEEFEDKRLAIVDVAKHRNGPTNDNIRLDFDDEFMRFSDRARGVDEDEPAPFDEEVDVL